VNLSRGLVVIVVVVLICITVLVFGFFIWPTPYRYEKISRLLRGGATEQEVYRIHRFTGESNKVVDPYPGNN
jgi:hypothetical protein